MLLATPAAPPAALLLAFAFVAGAAANLAIAAAVLVTAAIIGSACVRPFASSFRRLERRVVALGLGLGVMGEVVALLGALGTLRTSVVVALTIVVLVLAIAAFAAGRAIQSPADADDGRRDPVPPLLPVLLMALLVIPVLYVMAPETEVDATWYHLPVAAAFADTGTLAAPVELIYRYFPQLAESLYALVLLFAGFDAPKLLHLAAGLATAVAVYALASRDGDRRAGFVAAILWVAMPMALWEMTTAYVDLFAALFAALAAIAAVRWSESGHLRDALLCGVFLGFGLSTKLTFGALAAGVILAMLVTRRVRQSLRGAVAAGLATLLIASPWYVRALVATGNPIYPYLNTLFGARGFDPIADAVASAGGVGAVVPWRTAFDNSAFCESLLVCHSVVPMLLVVTVPLTLLRRSRSTRLLAIVALISATITFVLVPAGRYLIPSFAVGAAAIADAVTAVIMGSQLRRRLGAAAAAMLILLSTISITFIVDRGNDPFGYDVGAVTRERYLATRYRYFEMLQWMESHIEPGARVLRVSAPFVGEAPFIYTTHPIFIAEFTLEGRDVLAARDAADAIARLRAHGFRYLIVDEGSPQDWSASHVVSSASFASSELSRLFTGRLVALYEVAALRSSPPQGDSAGPASAVTMKGGAH